MTTPAHTPDPATSCAEAIARGDQHPLINDVMGVICGDYSYRLLTGQPIHAFITFVDTESVMAVKAVPISPENVLSYLS